MPALAVAVASLIAVLLIGIWFGGHSQYLPGFVRGVAGTKNERILREGLGAIRDDYYRKLSDTDLQNLALTGAVAGLQDRFSRYIAPSQYKAFQQETDGEFSGIGVTASRELGKGVRIGHVFKGSPALKAGLKSGDLIVAVNGTSIANRSPTDPTNLIRGPAGTTVSLTVLRGKTRFTRKVVRATIEQPSVQSKLVHVGDKTFGWVALSGFTSGAHGEVRAAVDRMLRRGAQGIVFDLRGNGGGLLDEAVLIASVFIKDGTVVTTDGRTRPRHVYTATGDAISPKIPVVVLVDRNSASASEIVTGALQDRHRAKVIGTHTFGKGVFQEIRELSNGGALDITVGEYFTPSGRNLGGGGVKRGAGITPDVPAKDNPKTKRDEALAIALKTLAAETPK